jgi:hypothetical protein
VLTSASSDLVCSGTVDDRSTFRPHGRSNQVSDASTLSYADRPQRLYWTAMRPH